MYLRMLYKYAALLGFILVLQIYMYKSGRCAPNGSYHKIIKSELGILFVRCYMATGSGNKSKQGLNLKKNKQMTVYSKRPTVNLPVHCYLIP